MARAYRGAILAVILASLALSSCEADAPRRATTSPCARLDEGQAQQVCEAFVGAVEARGSDFGLANYLVFRTFCGDRVERLALPAEQPRAAVADAVESYYRGRHVSEPCTHTLEALVPRGQPLTWLEMSVDELYTPSRDALVILAHPAEVITPLDFASAPPDASADAIRKLPHLYTRLYRNPDYFGDDTHVQLHSLRTLASIDGEIVDARHHRIRVPAADEASLVEGVRRAAAWFEGMKDTERDKFYYEYDPYRDAYEEHAYNLLRHAGSSWAIMQAYGLTGEERFRELGEYALAWVDRHSRTEQVGGETIRYVVEPWNRKAKLGGAGLWLLALAEHARLTGETDHIETMQEIANYIRHAQDAETGKFASFHEAEGLVVSDHQSDYYPGEAMFGLHRARPFLRDIRVCDITRRGLQFMLRDEPRHLPAAKHRFVNQWHAYAIREYRRDCDDDRFDWVWRRDLGHMLAGAATLQDDPVMAGAYLRPDGELVTSPTRLEALTLICTELGAEEPAVARRCEPVMRRVAGMQLSFQNRPENAWLWRNPEATYGGFAQELDDETIRIDFTQHHLSAMYNAVEFFRYAAPRVGGSEGQLALRRDWPFNLVGERTCREVGRCSERGAHTR